LAEPARAQNDCFRKQAGKELTVQKLYETLQELHLLGDPPVHYNTVLRLVKMKGWLPVQKRTDIRKAFEVEQVNDLGIGDFLHGPQVRAGNRSHKAILYAIIDDHSRLVVGQAFSASETISALAGISLIHSKPYDRPSRGKVERFFRRIFTSMITGSVSVGSSSSIKKKMPLYLKDPDGSIMVSTDTFVCSEFAFFGGDVIIQKVFWGQKTKIEISRKNGLSTGKKKLFIPLVFIFIMTGFFPILQAPVFFQGPGEVPGLDFRPHPGHLLQEIVAHFPGYFAGFPEEIPAGFFKVLKDRLGIPPPLFQGRF